MRLEHFHQLANHLSVPSVDELQTLNDIRFCDSEFFQGSLKIIKQRVAELTVTDKASDGCQQLITHSSSVGSISQASLADSAGPIPISPASVMADLDRRPAKTSGTCGSFLGCLLCRLRARKHVQCPGMRADKAGKPGTLLGDR